MTSRGRQFLETLHERILIGDGAMGSRLYELGASLGSSYDYLNLIRPHLVRQVHREYLDAGAQLIETNTFSANRIKLGQHGLENHLAEINRAGIRLAREAAGERAFVAAAVGPLPAPQPEVSIEDVSETLAREAFREQIGHLADAGADLILLETFTDLQQLRWALDEARKIGDLPIVAQMTFPDGRHAPDGTDAYSALETLRREGAAVVGTNCGQGVARVRNLIEYVGPLIDAPLSAFANAGLPQQVGGRFLYLATPQYMADSAEQMARAGASLIGGCCGTTAADIAAIAARVASLRPAKRNIVVHVAPAAAPQIVPPPPPPDFLARLKEKTVVLVELDPPRTTDVQMTLRGAKALKEAGADVVTLGDSPLAMLRMDGMIAGSLIQREVDIPVICHLACRDRNLVGTQSLLLGAHALGMRNILTITGDPAKLGDHPAASSVYDLNSFKLIELVMQMNQGRNHAGQPIGRPTAFCVGVAFNPNVRNLDMEVKRLARKVERGARFALTQAVFDAQTMRRACAAAHELGIPVFAGIYPLLSSRNAEFMHNEFPGVSICEDVRRRMAAAGPDKEKMVAEGLAIAKELIDAFLECADGLYLISPLNRPKTPIELLKHVRAKESRTAQGA